MEVKGYVHPPVTRRPCWCKRCGVGSSPLIMRAGVPGDYWIKVTRKEG